MTGPKLPPSLAFGFDNARTGPNKRSPQMIGKSNILEHSNLWNFLHLKISQQPHSITVEQNDTEYIVMDWLAFPTAEFHTPVKSAATAISQHRPQALSPSHWKLLINCSVIPSLCTFNGDVGTAGIAKLKGRCYTGWPIRFVKTYCWHWCESCVLVWGP